MKQVLVSRHGKSPLRNRFVWSGIFDQAFEHVFLQFGYDEYRIRCWPALTSRNAYACRNRIGERL